MKNQAKVRKPKPMAPIEHLENFFALSIDLMCIASIDGYLKSINPAGTKLLGYSEWEMLTIHFTDIVHPADKEKTREELEQLKRGIPSVNFECRLLTKDKGYRWLSWRCTPSEDGLIYAVARDLTDKKVAEALYAQAREKMVSNSKLSALGEMAGGIAHEVNNPLSIILGRSGLLISALQSQKEVDRNQLIEIASTIETTSLRIAKIVQGLRHFSRDGANDDIQLAKVSEIVTETLSFCAQRFKARQVLLHVGEFEQELTLQCRPVQISQVLLNLLNNAFYGVTELPEKWIKLEILDTGSSVEIAISDSGAGIPENMREKIFQPFYTTKPVGSGTGLGLSISKGIAEAHNGKLELDQNSKNTRFVITLPKSQP